MDARAEFARRGEFPFFDDADWEKLGSLFDIAALIRLDELYRGPRCNGMPQAYMASPDWDEMLDGGFKGMPVPFLDSLLGDGLKLDEDRIPSSIAIASNGRYGMASHVFLALSLTGKLDPGERVVLLEMDPELFCKVAEDVRLDLVWVGDPSCDSIARIPSSALQMVNGTCELDGSLVDSDMYDAYMEFCARTDIHAAFAIRNPRDSKALAQIPLSWDLLSFGREIPGEVETVLCTQGTIAFEHELLGPARLAQDGSERIPLPDALLKRGPKDIASDGIPYEVAEAVRLAGLYGIDSAVGAYMAGIGIDDIICKTEADFL